MQLQNMDYYCFISLHPWSQDSVRASALHVWTPNLSTFFLTNLFRRRSSCEGATINVISSDRFWTAPPRVSVYTSHSCCWGNWFFSRFQLWLWDIQHLGAVLRSISIRSFQSTNIPSNHKFMDQAKHQTSSFLFSFLYPWWWWRYLGTALRLISK